MAPDSNTEIGRPPGPLWSTSAGILLLGEMARNSALNWSPLLMLTKRTLYGSPHSSSMIAILKPFGVGQKCRSIEALLAFAVFAFAT
jgi:hypothetical protein